MRGKIKHLSSRLLGSVRCRYQTECAGAWFWLGFTTSSDSGMLALPEFDRRMTTMELTALVETVKELSEREAVLRRYL